MEFRNKTVLINLACLSERFKHKLAMTVFRRVYGFEVPPQLMVRLILTWDVVLPKTILGHSPTSELLRLEWGMK